MLWIMSINIRYHNRINLQDNYQMYKSCPCKNCPYKNCPYKNRVCRTY